MHMVTSERKIIIREDSASPDNLGLRAEGDTLSVPKNLGTALQAIGYDTVELLLMLLDEMPEVLAHHLGWPVEDVQKAAADAKAEFRTLFESLPPVVDPQRVYKFTAIDPRNLPPVAAN